MKEPATQTGFTIDEMSNERAHRVLEQMLEANSDSMTLIYKLMFRLLTQKIPPQELISEFLEEADHIREGQEEAERENAVADMGDSMSKEEREACA